MLRFDNCPSCFAPLDGQQVCKKCGYNYSSDRKQPKGAIKPFSVLGDRYMVGRVLGKGGFGVTYVAKDVIKNTFCAIKEYMPTEYSERDSSSDNIYPKNDRKSKYVFIHGREKFVEEAKTLIMLKSNPIVVDIIDYFNQNNTAYLVMEYLDGCDLRTYKRDQGGRIDADYAKVIFVTVASALMEIHRRNILHRDLSPENIFLTKNGDIKLIDFGAARDYVSSQNKGMSILLKHGFAPPEQYATDGVQGPWTDVYALCATFYNVVSGKGVKDAILRYRGANLESLAELGCPVSERTSEVINKGLELDYRRRYKDFGSLLKDLDINTGSVRKNSSKPRTESQKPELTPGKHSKVGSESQKQDGSESERQKQHRLERNPQNQYKIEQESPQNGKIHVGIDHEPITDSPDPEPNTEKKPVRKPEAYLCVISDNKVTKEYPLVPDVEFLIGRSEQRCDCVIRGNSNISRVHCSVRCNSADGKYLICDKSVNGTFFSDGFRLKKDTLYTIRAGYAFYLVGPKYRFVIIEKD